jgi:hypothetical protein
MSYFVKAFLENADVDEPAPAAADGAECAAVPRMSDSLKNWLHTFFKVFSDSFFDVLAMYIVSTVMMPAP